MLISNSLTSFPTACALLFVMALAQPARGQELQLVAPQSAPGDAMGASLAAWEDVLVIGAPKKASSNGAAHVYERSSGRWAHQAMLVPHQAGGIERFGQSVAIHGARILVGAPQFSGPGQVWTFVRNGGLWTYEARFQAGHGVNGDAFGSAVALRDDLAFVGAPGRDLSGIPDVGAIYVFRRVNGQWTQQQELHHGDINNYDTFGSSVCFDGQRLVVGAPGDDEMGTDAGAVYVFAPSGEAFDQQAKLIPAMQGDWQRHGTSVSIDGSRLAFGGGLANTPGSAEVHEFVPPASWIRVGVVSASDGYPSDRFGIVSLEGDALVVGAPGWSGAVPGSAYVFTTNGTGWTEIVKRSASDGSAFDSFGSAVWMLGEELCVGAPESDPAGTNSGSAYLYPTFPLHVSAHCLADASQPCPCENHFATAGCANSTGAGALLSAGGSTSTLLDDLVLSAASMASLQAAVLVVGSAIAAPSPLGDGILCIQPPLVRFDPFITSALGTAAWGPGLGAQSVPYFPQGGHFLPGTAWHFQVWYRDGAGPCGSASNLTNALEVRFGP